MAILIYIIVAGIAFWAWSDYDALKKKVRGTDTGFELAWDRLNQAEEKIKHLEKVLRDTREELYDAQRKLKGLHP